MGARIPNLATAKESTGIGNDYNNKNVLMNVTGRIN